MSTSKRYKNLKKHPGIRQDLQSKNYQVQKSIKGKRHSKVFSRLQDAINWQRTFSGDLGFPKFDSKDVSENDELVFGELWETYKKEHLLCLQSSTIENRLELAKCFDDLFSIPVIDIDPSVISNFILAQKEKALKLKNHRRKSFTQELKLLKAIFNWYIELFDHKYSNPVTKHHKKLGVISRNQTKNKKMSPDELRLFFQELKDDPFWFDFAITQFFCAGRVSEIAGLQRRSIDLNNRTLLIKDAVVWSKASKRFVELKELPKNGEIRGVYINDLLYESLSRRIREMGRRSGFIFTYKGEPLTYRKIQATYDNALKKCGLYGRYSGTHIMRHSMATVTRMVTGSLEATQAITGHKDQRLVQHYAALDSSVNQAAQLQIQNFLKSGDVIPVIKCDHIV